MFIQLLFFFSLLLEFPYYEYPYSHLNILVMHFLFYEELKLVLSYFDFGDIPARLRDSSFGATIVDFFLSLFFPFSC